MFEHSINGPVWMGFSDLKHLVACCFAAESRWSHIRETRSHDTGVERRQPDMRLMEL